MKFCLAPPKMRVAPQMPPQIPRPGAATGFRSLSLFISLKNALLLRCISTEKLNSMTKMVGLDSPLSMVNHFITSVTR